MSEYNLLDRVDSPADLRRLTTDELTVYCRELRRFIIDSLARNPGHLGASLGAVELSAALHYVFNTPDDKIVWDVGHQAYAHKIITSRRDLFATNRLLGGISGFPRMAESPYDAFGAGHASVSISAALGIAEACELLGERRHVVAVIGDGALTGGLAFEGLNNAGASGSDLLVILNDNRISIDRNAGAMKDYLLSLTTSDKYNRLKVRVWNMLDKVPGLRSAIRKTGNAIKWNLVPQSNLFESIGFRYFGPVDGHDVKALCRVLGDLKSIPGPKLLHILTVKGKGYLPAEQNQSLWHAPGKFNPETGEIAGPSSGGHAMRYQDVFGETITALAGTDPRVVGITPAMPTGCSLSIMMERMPRRCFDVGIAEGHAVTFSAGLATMGFRPFCNIYSSFMQRAYDNVIHDVALQNLGVIFCLDRAGIVGEDGATHQGAFDIAFFMPIPNLVIAAPRNEGQLRRLMYTALEQQSPFVIRYPRGKGPGEGVDAPLETLAVGRAELLREGEHVAVLTLGHVGNFAAEAIARAAEEGVSAAHIDLIYAKPLDEQMLHRVGREFDRVITVEDGVVIGGVGGAVADFMMRHGYGCRVEKLGIPDAFIEHGTPAQLHRLCGYDAEGIFRKIMER
ncbi:1-deoxy-D-xylulose-5-phosphate synthase [Bacteroidia bacterium]|nr:1-deoxy-D-xylulose-5-phosphate synthase [Bacteroidia bacterium]